MGKKRNRNIRFWINLGRLFIFCVQISVRSWEVGRAKTQAESKRPSRQFKWKVSAIWKRARKRRRRKKKLALFWIMIMIILIESIHANIFSYLWLKVAPSSTLSHLPLLFNLASTWDNFSSWLSLCHSLFYNSCNPLIIGIKSFFLLSII